MEGGVGGGAGSAVKPYPQRIYLRACSTRKSHRSNRGLLRKYRRKYCRVRRWAPRNRASFKRRARGTRRQPSSS